MFIIETIVLHTFKSILLELNCCSLYIMCYLLEIIHIFMFVTYKACLIKCQEKDFEFFFVKSNNNHPNTNIDILIKTHQSLGND